jgi:cytosine/adenosine deaminase-related metal-dependent hydrolase
MYPAEALYSSFLPPAGGLFSGIFSRRQIYAISHPPGPLTLRMAFHKFQAEKIFDGRKFLDPGQVLITAEDGTVEAIVPVSEAGDDIQRVDGIISPGFINCHCHLELSHMKGRIPEKTGLVDFVFKVVTERHHAEEEILQAISDAEDEMRKNGIVAVGDICNNALTIPQKQKNRLAYYNFIEASGWLPSVSEIRFQRVKQLYEQYRAVNCQPPTANCSIVPHAPYSVSENLWNAIQPYFENRTVSIHNQETAFEDEFFLEGTGDFSRMYELMKIDNIHHQPTKRSSLQSYFDKLAKAKNIILVHNTFTKEDDINFTRTTINARLNDSFEQDQRSTFFCLCINANQYIENAVPPVDMFRSNNCNIVLGTDSLASNWSLSIADEMKMIRKHFPSVPLEEILGWATLNGANALEMERKSGSFEKGKTPGVVTFDDELKKIDRLL